MTSTVRLTSDDLVCYLVTDTGMCGGAAGVVATVRAAVAHGATFVQVRDPEATDEELVSLGRAVVQAVAGRVPVVLNDRVDLVAETGADGAHIGQGDIDPEEARRILGPDALLGLSVQTLEHVDRARTLPEGTLDYLGVGPIWSQQTKLDAARPSSPALLAEVVAHSPWPCVAIGGVGPGRVQTVKQAGAGMAIVSAICAAEDPGAATAQILQEWAGPAGGNA